MARTMVRILMTGLLVGTCGVASGLAIVIRHDRDDARYRELGARYPAVARILPDGTGVLVAPRYVLTAAHVARGIETRSPRVEIGGKEYRVSRIFTHPDWSATGAHDVAVLRLARPVKHVRPVALYGGDDEVGQTVTFVGSGDFGSGLTGPQTMDGIRRGATNVVESADEDWLYFRFDEPPAGTELEGVSGPGDSGGPAILTRDSVVYTLGVSVFADGDQGPGRYGVREGYTRVSSHRDWIESILSGTTPDAGIEPGARSGPRGRPEGVAVPMRSGGPVSLPDTAAGRRVTAYLDAYNSADGQRMLDYQQDSFAAKLLEDKSAGERVAFYRRLFDELFGELVLRQVLKVDADGITILLEAGKGGMAEFRFEIQPDPPHKITGIRVARVSVDGPASGKP